ncbi:aldo keto reductase family protein [Stylonychia lemnae]|uniref:Aldo keto reductase family protein n=1 Tax=Stylonychia lemnae TaxID=5949 RepID=A0A078BD00_STYLE|nr:aldo keto reductase family protein [Stylonychia lemnae]|eukprot:CDW91092.1 aldo keto reductase family protein [Stylonychia lemnae]
MVESNDKYKTMEYRYLGNSGIKVSVLSFGNWLNSNKEEDYNLTRDAIKKCFDAGVNFYDTAEGYGLGNAETQMGKAFKELNLPREELVVTTKLFKLGDGPNDGFLSRKHIQEGLKNSIKRLQLDYVDVVYCHRPDFNTPLEETCRAMHDQIEKGRAFYWGTSEWPADRISKAIELCTRLRLHKPIVEQCQYSMLCRDRFEKEYRRLFSETKYGTTIWSPLAGGILSGKYNDGNIPEGSRYDNHKILDRIWQLFMGEAKRESSLKKLNALEKVAKELGYTQAQLSLAWAIANTDVSTCILGFTKLSQVDENLKSIELLRKWNQEIENKVTSILENNPEPDMDWRKWAPMEQRRAISLYPQQ